MTGRLTSVVDWTRTAAKLTKMKNARFKRAKRLLFLSLDMQICGLLVAVIVVVIVVVVIVDVIGEVRPAIIN